MSEGKIPISPKIPIRGDPLRCFLVPALLFLDLVDLNRSVRSLTDEQEARQEGPLMDGEAGCGEEPLQVTGTAGRRDLSPSLGAKGGAFVVSAVSSGSSGLPQSPLNSGASGGVWPNQEFF